MEKRSREFQIFVKPVGSVCNLACKYCYYLDKRTLYPDADKILMADDLLEKYIVQHIRASTEDIITFSWHGGEPLLAGINFFRKIVCLQAKYKPSGKRIMNGIQTNGTLLDDKWCRFFADENFMIGISLDGTEEFHNKCRRKKDDSESWHQAINGYQLLMKHGIVPEILCVVNAENVRQPLTIYSFFKKLGAKYITFLPLVEKESGSPGGVSKISVPSKEFGYFLSDIFDEWIENDIGEVKIQIFEEAARSAFDQEHTLCIFKRNCGGVPVVEHNGDFYSCDHYVDKDHLLGNIREYSITCFLDSIRQNTFGKAKSIDLPAYCVDCEVRSMCNGECPKNRFILTPEGEPGLNYLCTGYKYFFNHCRPFVEAIAEAWKNQKR